MPWIFGKKPSERTLEERLDFGFVVIDKPRGPTSHQVSSWVKEIVRAKKAGHVGTLDPNVTGVLPVGLEKATRLADYLHEEGKEYVGIMILHKDVPEDVVREIFREFTGEIFQYPPVRSAVARTLRKRKIYKLTLLEKKDRLVLFRASVESGVYIRTLCRDIGDALLVGANMLELRRIRSGPVDENKMVTLQKLKDAYELYKQGDPELLNKIIIDPEEITRDFPFVRIKDSAVDAMAHGSKIYRSGILEDYGEGNIVRILSTKDELLAMGKREGNEIKPETVFIERGIYPKAWKNR